LEEVAGFGRSTNNLKLLENVLRHRPLSLWEPSCEFFEMGNFLLAQVNPALWQRWRLWCLGFAFLDPILSCLLI
jgi:hypothetical protein